MAINRREFIKACGGAVAAFAVATAPAIGFAVGRRVWMIPELTKELFEGYLGETFTALTPEGPVSLTLADVQETPARHRELERGDFRTEGFAVRFDGRPETPLAQGTYTLRNDRMGEVTLFMTPVVCPDPSKRRYEIVINRIVQA